MRVKGIVCTAALAAVLLLAGCTSSTETRTQQHADANSPAGKVGQAAHRAAYKLNKAAVEAGRDLKKAARQAQAGWDEASRKDQKKER